MGAWCEILTSSCECQKPYIRGVYAYEITAKGLIGQRVLVCLEGGSEAFLLYKLRRLC